MTQSLCCWDRGDSRLREAIVQHQPTAETKCPVSTEPWTHSHLAWKKLFFSGTITPETCRIFRSASKSLTSHGIPLSFSLFMSHTRDLAISVLSSFSTLIFISYIFIWSFPFLVIHVLHRSYIVYRASNQITESESFPLSTHVASHPTYS